VLNSYWAVVAGKLNLGRLVTAFITGAKEGAAVEGMKEGASVEGISDTAAKVKVGASVAAKVGASVAAGRVAAASSGVYVGNATKLRGSLLAVTT